MTDEVKYLRSGMPSAKAIEAHDQNGGLWVALFGTRGGGRGSIMFVSFSGDEMAVWDDEEWHNYEYAISLELALRSWSFWPCDEFGNKVSWPTDSHGNKL